MQSLLFEAYTQLWSQFSAIQKEYRVLRDIIENFPQYVYWKDIKFVYQGCNQAVAAALNLKASSEIVGKTDRDFGWSKERVDLLRKNDKEVLEKGECEIFEDLIPQAGSLKIMLTSKKAIYDSVGKVVGILGISVDITKEKQAEIAKDNFLSNMEHDLRTPFAGIGGVADLLSSVYGEKYPELKELFTILTKSCAQWEEVHNRIFDALDTTQELKVECFYIQDEMEKMRELMGATSKLKNIKFELSYPAKEETGAIETDLLKFKLILSSLVGNAFSFTEKGKVKLKLIRQKNAFVLYIKDTGIGIPKEKQEEIFEKFAKLSRSNTYGGSFKGLGLGLYNAREDAKKIGAVIKVQSEQGKGSIFSFKLPVKL